MSEHFYIDTLDGIGGAAFASFREGNLTTASSAGDEPAWFIAAPDFSPNPVSSRAIALAANNGSFQLGFSVDGETEVSFESLEVLAEYVRRLFVAGGGGDGTGGVGPATPTPPEGGGPGEGGDFDVESSVGQLLNFAKEMRGHIEELPGQAHVHKLSELVNAPANTPSRSLIEGPLYIGARAIGWGLANSDRGTTLEERENWRLAQSAYEWTVLSHGLDVEYSYDQLFLEFGYRYRPWWPFTQPVDPLDALAMFALPPSVRLDENWRSVKDFMYAALARPEVLIEGPFGLRASVLIYASSCILLRPGIWATDLEELTEFHRRCEHVALDWIAAQLPRFAFARSLEDAITAAEIA